MKKEEKDLIFIRELFNNMIYEKLSTRNTSSNIWTRSPSHTFLRTGPTGSDIPGLLVAIHIYEKCSI